MRRVTKMLDVRQLKEACKSHGPEVVALRLTEALAEKKISPRQFSIKKLWEGMVGPVEETISSAQEAFHSRLVRRRKTEAIQANAFAFVMGNVVLEEVMAGYEIYPSVVDQLVRATTSTMKLEPVVGFQAFGSIGRVPEGQQYGESQGSEKSLVNPEPDKYGGMVSITEEAIIFDMTGQILDQANQIGIEMFNHRENEGIKSVEDAAGYKTYYPSTSAGAMGTQTDLFRAAAGVGTAWYNKTINEVTGTNALVDWTSVDAALALFFGMKDEKDRPIVVNPQVCLVPYAKMSTAIRIFGATEVRRATDTAANLTVSDSPIRTLAPGITAPMTSPFLTSSANWFIGDPKRQFKERVIMAPGVREIPGDPERDIVVKFQARRKTGFEATDDKYWVKNVG